MSDYFVHSSSIVDKGARIGLQTRVWHFSHIMTGAIIGKGCNLGQNVMIASGVKIGNNVKIQNNVSVYAGTTIEDDVFLGPSCVLTNVTNPRSQVNRQALYEPILIRRGATIGANATIICGISIGKYAFIGAGAVITCNVPDYALFLGTPGRQKGWMSRHGHRLTSPDHNRIMVCPESGFRYQLSNEGSALKCLDLEEEAPLPEKLATGIKVYGEYK